MQIPFIDTPLLLMDRQLDRLESIVTHFKSELEDLNLDPHSLSLYGHGLPEETQELISQFSGNEDLIEDIVALKRKSPGHGSPSKRQSSLGHFLLELKEKVLEAKGNVKELSRKFENSPCVSPMGRELPSPEGGKMVKRIRSGSLGGLVTISTEISRGELFKNEKNGGKLMEVEGLRKENGELRGEIENLKRENELLRKKLEENREKNKENQRKIEKNQENDDNGDEFILDVIGFFFK